MANSPSCGQPSLTNINTDIHVLVDPFMARDRYICRGQLWQASAEGLSMRLLFCQMITQTCFITAQCAVIAVSARQGKWQESETSVSDFLLPKTSFLPNAGAFHLCGQCYVSFLSLLGLITSLPGASFLNINLRVVFATICKSPFTSTALASENLPEPSQILTCNCWQNHWQLFSETQKVPLCGQF